MAKSFTLKSHSYDGRYLELTCTQTGDAATNTSKVQWTLSAKGGEDSYYTTGPTTVKIGGSTVYYKAKTSYSTGKFPAAKGSVSGETTVSHKEDGTAKVTVSIKTNIYTGVLKTTEDTWTLNAIDRYAIVKKAPDFTDEGNLTLTYTAPSDLDSWSAVLRLGTEDLISRKNSASFTFTQAERELLRSKTPNASKLALTAVLRSVRGSTTYESSLPVNMTVVPAYPEVSVSVRDENDAVATITGDDRLLVAGKSHARVSVSAQGQKGASIRSVQVRQGSNTLSGSGVLTPGGTEPIRVTVTDSRGLATTLEADNTIAAYTLPTCRVVPVTPTGQGELTLTAMGRCYCGAIGNTENTLQAQYQYKTLTEESYGDWQPMTVSAVSGEYTAQAEVQLPDYRQTYLIRARVTDALSQKVSEAQRFVATPVFDWSGEDFCFRVPVSFLDKEKQDNALQIVENRITNLADPQEDQDAVSKAYLESILPRPKLLWEGSWSSGTITVPETSHHLGYRIAMSGQGTAILAFRYGSHIRGIGGYTQENGEATIYQFTATLDGNNWTFVACNSFKHNASGSHGSNSGRTVTEIRGLF